MSQSLEEMISSKLIAEIRPLVLETVNTKLGDGRTNKLEDLIEQLIQKMNEHEIWLELLSIKQLEVMTGVSKSTIRRWIKEGSFPKPVNLGGNIRRWRRREVMTYFDNLEYTDSMEVLA